MEQPFQPNPFPKPETPRTGKYCPRCRGHGSQRPGAVPAVRPSVPQQQHGHRQPAARQQRCRPLKPDHAVHPAAPQPSSGRARRRAVPRGFPPPPAAVAAPSRRRPGGPARRGGLLWSLHRRQAAADTSPVGTWETTLHGKAAASAHLEFALRPGGEGRFAWHESGPAALSGQTPLRWNLNPDKTLSLALSPAAGGSAVSESLAGVFSSHAWTWHIDRSPRRLLLGSLVFTEKR